MAISVELLDSNKPEEVPVIPETDEPSGLESFLSDEEDDLDLDIVEAIEGDEGSSSSASEDESATDETEPKSIEEEPAAGAEAEAGGDAAVDEEPAPDSTPTPEQQAADAEAANAVSEPIGLTPEQVVQARSQMEAQLVEHYKLDEATAEEFELNPSEALPKILARVFMDSVTTTLEQVVQQLPNWSARDSQTRQVNKRHEDSFYDSWPALKSAEATPAVIRIGQVYRQLNPKASAADFIRDVGAQAMVSLRLPVEGNRAAETPRQRPFKPAGSSAKRGAVSKSDNIFSQMSDEMDAEDLDLD